MILNRALVVLLFVDNTHHAHIMHDSGKRTFIDHLSSIADPRRVHKKLHELVDILFLSTCAVLAGADGPTEIEAFGVDRIEWLRKFVPLAKGVPSHDTIGRVLSRIKVEAFQSAFCIG